MDLFTPKVKEKRLHPYIHKIISDKSYEPVIKVLQDWSNGLTGRKKELNKFIIEFQTTFNSSLWELYLNKAFSDLGFEIDYSKESPDFSLIHRSGKIVSVEAVTSNHRLNEKKAYYSGNTLKSTIVDNEEKFLKNSTLKLLGKLRDKRNLFVGADNKKFPYCSLDHVKGNPFVIAIAPFDNHLSFIQNNMAINRVLYGIEPPKPNAKGELVSDYITHIRSQNGANIELGLFTNDSYKEISAVIFSTTGMFGKAILQSGIGCQVHATRYRQQSIEEFLSTEGTRKLGVSQNKLTDTHEILSFRFQSGKFICGSDKHLCNSTEYKESHIDGLHVYYNPYAEVSLDRDLINAYEITQNFYDTTSKSMVCYHNDGSLVSRQVFTIHH